MTVVNLTQLEDLTDVRVIELAGNLGLINEHLDEALQDLDHIVHSEHLKKSQQLPILKKLLAKP